MPENEFPTVRSLLTARRVEFTVDDRVNLLDVGHTFYTDEVRAVSDIAVYASIRIERNQAHDYGPVSFRIVDEQDETLVETDVVRLTVPQRHRSGGDDAYCGAVFSSICLPPGNYGVELVYDRATMASAPLYVIAGEKPQNVGRIQQPNQR
jgi:hypothetical protein